jgi:hypothetical protein
MAIEAPSIEYSSTHGSSGGCQHLSKIVYVELFADKFYRPPGTVHSGTLSKYFRSFDRAQTSSGWRFFSGVIAVSGFVVAAVAAGVALFGER